MTSRPARIAAVVAAAGASRRFGSNKLIAPVRGEPLVRRTVQRVLEAKPDHTVVVVGTSADAVRAALDGLPVEFATNPEPARGLGRSIAAGVRALPAGIDAAIILLGDQPDVSLSLLLELRATWARTRADIVVPSYRGLRAPPVLFARAVFDELMALNDDSGARVVVERVPDRVQVVTVDHDLPADIDEPLDLQRLE